jgi:hypothetical protein
MSNGIDLNLNKFEKQKNFDVIPAGTLATVMTKLKGTYVPEIGDMDYISYSASGNQMLDFGFVIVDTAQEYIGRIIWQKFVIDPNSPVAMNISFTAIRAMWEAAKGIDPEDMTEAAQQARQLESVEQLNNIAFQLVISVVKSKDKKYADRNGIKRIITPDEEGYVKCTDAQIEKWKEQFIYLGGADYSSGGSAGYFTAQPKTRPQVQAQPTVPKVSIPTPNWAT